MRVRIQTTNPAIKPLNRSVSSAIVLLVLLGASTLYAGSGRDNKQAELDAACEAAREKILAPLRKQFVEECVQKKEQSDRAACEAYYSDYGARSGDRAPLYYDIPECQKAFEYQNSQRKG